jgi:hypothetical protein
MEYLAGYGSDSGSDNEDTKNTITSSTSRGISSVTPSTKITQYKQSKQKIIDVFQNYMAKANALASDPELDKDTNKKLEFYGCLVKLGEAATFVRDTFKIKHYYDELKSIVLSLINMRNQIVHHVAYNGKDRDQEIKDKALHGHRNNGYGLSSCTIILRELGSFSKSELIKKVNLAQETPYKINDCIEALNKLCSQIGITSTSGNSEDLAYQTLMLQKLQIIKDLSDKCKEIGKKDPELVAAIETLSDKTRELRNLLAHYLSYPYISQEELKEQLNEASQLVEVVNNKCHEFTVKESKTPVSFDFFKKKEEKKKVERNSYAITITPVTPVVHKKQMTWFTESKNVISDSEKKREGEGEGEGDVEKKRKKIN